MGFHLSSCLFRIAVLSNPQYAPSFSTSTTLIHIGPEEGNCIEDDQGLQTINSLMAGNDWHLVRSQSGPICRTSVQAW